MAEARPVSRGSEAPELSVVLFNVHSSDPGVKAKDRQECLRDMLDSVLAEDLPGPLFVLCQESINGPKHKIVCDKLGHKPKALRCQAEAGIYYRLDSAPSTLQVRYVDVSKLRKTEDRIGLEPNVPFELGRLMACVVTLPGGSDGSGKAGADGKNILMVSWHGPETKAKKNVNLKCDCFDRLVRFSERLREDESCHVVMIGGDFNLPPEKAREVLESLRRQGEGAVDGVVLDKYTPPDDRKSLTIKDYIVYWPKDSLTNSRTAVIRPDYRRDKGTRPFDHPVVGYTFVKQEASRDATHAEEAPKVTPRQPEE